MHLIKWLVSLIDWLIIYIIFTCFNSLWGNQAIIDLLLLPFFYCHKHRVVIKRVTQMPHCHPWCGVCVFIYLCTVYMCVCLWICHSGEYGSKTFFFFSKENENVSWKILAILAAHRFYPGKDLNFSSEEERYEFRLRIRHIVVQAMEKAEQYHKNGNWTEVSVRPHNNRKISVPVFSCPLLLPNCFSYRRTTNLFNKSFE